MTKQYNKIGTQRAEMSASYRAPVPSTNFIFKYLRLGGTSSGTDDMNTTGGTTGTPQVYSWVCPAGSIAYLHRMCISHRDDSFPPAKYGGSTLANGVTADVYDNNTTGVLLDFMDGDPITAMAEWTHLAGTDVTLQAGTGPLNDDHMGVRWTFWNAGGSIELTSGQCIRMTMWDNMSHLTHMDAMVQGTIWPSTNDYGA